MARRSILILLLSILTWYVVSRPAILARGILVISRCAKVRLMAATAVLTLLLAQGIILTA